MTQKHHTRLKSAKVLFEYISYIDIIYIHIIYHISYKMVHILRFKLSDNIVELINEFAIKNKSLERKEYKKEWNKWMELNERVINEEIERMNKLGYNECIKDKMFKSGRYYFRKKHTCMPVTNVKPNDIEGLARARANGTDTNEVVAKAQKKRLYIKLSNTILNSMDSHIKKYEEYTPANGHKHYCLNHIDLLRKEKKECGMENIDEFLKKIKKTYKNRYFIINQKCNIQKQSMQKSNMQKQSMQKHTKG